MKANELIKTSWESLNRKSLMIGDWVEVPFLEGKPKIVKVEEILSDEINPEWDGMENYGGIKIKYVNPIPLTPEILEKNNFKKCVVTNGMEIDKKFNPYHITEQLYIHDGMCGTIVCCSDGGSKLSPLFECKYVHQLQHILKASGILNEIVL